MPEGPKEPSVIYIAGYSRSGSTLLDRLIGQLEGYCSVGELMYIWQRGMIRNEPCGCGKPFNECEFWTAVVREAFGRLQPADVESIKSLQAGTMRLRHIPCLAWPAWRTRRYEEQVVRYRAVMGELHRAIRKVAGCRIIVDSSKKTTMGLLWAGMPDVRARVVHLIRDSRAVAYSWRRRKLWHQFGSRREFMEIHSLWKTAWLWSLVNISVRLIKPEGGRHTVRYEDLVRQPGKVLRDILTWEGSTEPDTAFIDLGGGARLKFAHTVSGNPMRFDQGRVMIALDDQWRTGMKRADQVLMTALTWPLLRAYGYL